MRQALAKWQHAAFCSGQCPWPCQGCSAQLSRKKTNQFWPKEPKQPTKSLKERFGRRVWRQSGPSWAETWSLVLILLSFCELSSNKSCNTYLNDPLSVLPGMVVLCVLTENVCDELQFLRGVVQPLNHHAPVMPATRSSEVYSYSQSVILEMSLFSLSCYCFRLSETVINWELFYCWSVCTQMCCCGLYMVFLVRVSFDVSWTEQGPRFSCVTESVQASDGVAGFKLSCRATLSKLSTMKTACLLAQACLSKLLVQ